jgi:hypothetical protein
MMKDIEIPSAGKFRPVSLQDFTRYAKSLAWLIELPLQRSQELLAQIYGYADRHELQRVMAIPGEPGPFDSEWFSRDEDNDLGSNNGVDLAGRGNRTLALVARNAGIELKDLSGRQWKSREIGLFDHPYEHREKFRHVQTMFTILESDSGECPARAAQEYANLEVTTDGTEYLLRFTPLGRSVFKAIDYIVEGYEIQSASKRPIKGSDVLSFMAQMDNITQQHPNNPWSRAIKISWVASRYNFMPLEMAEEWMFEEAKRSVELFELLFDGHGRQAAEYKLMSYHADNSTWPEVLRWGGEAAMLCGDFKTAKRWLKVCKKLTRNKPIGANELLEEIEDLSSRALNINLSVRSKWRMQ